MVAQEVSQEVSSNLSLQSLKVPVDSRNAYIVSSLLEEQGLIEKPIEVWLDASSIAPEGPLSEAQVEKLRERKTLSGILEGVCMGPGLMLRNPRDGNRYVVELGLVEAVTPLEGLPDGQLLIETDQLNVRCSLAKLRVMEAQICEPEETKVETREAEVPAEAPQPSIKGWKRIFHFAH